MEFRVGQISRKGMLQRLGVEGKKGPAGEGQGVIRGQGSPARRLVLSPPECPGGLRPGLPEAAVARLGRGREVVFGQAAWTACRRRGRPVSGEDGRAGDLKAGGEPRATCG